AGAIAAASPERGEGRSFVDLERGIFYRLAPHEKATATRADSGETLSPHAALAREGNRQGAFRRVEWRARASVKTALKTAVRLAKLPGKITPHTLRHTAATWLMQNGVSMWRAAGFLGMSVETLDRVYGHHHPDYFSEAAEAIGRKPTRNQALVISLVGAV